MDTDLGGVMIVGAESDAATAFPRDLLTPAHDERRNFGEVRPVHLCRQRLEVMMRHFRDGQRDPHRMAGVILTDQSSRGRSMIRLTFAIAAAETSVDPAAMSSSPFFIPR